MNRQRNVTLGIAGTVVATAIVGIGVFLYFGSQLGVIALVVGIPTAVIVGTLVYVRSVATRPGGSAHEFVRQQGRTAGDELRKFHTEFSSLSERHPRWEPTTVISEFEHLQGALREEGVDFDPSDGTYSVSTTDANPANLEDLTGKIPDLQDDAEAAFESFVRAELDRLDGLADRLVEEGLANKASIAPNSIGEDPDEHEEALDDARTALGSRIEGAIDRLGALAAEQPDADLGDHLDSASDDAAEGRLEDAVDTLTAARAALESDLSTRFEADREELTSLVDVVLSSSVDEYVPADMIDAVERLKRELDGMESALDVDELDIVRDETRDACIEIVEEMASILDDDLSTLASASVSVEFYSRPEVADEDHVARLRGAATVEEFRRQWLQSVGELALAIDEISEKAAVAQAYPKISDRIDDALREHGEVTGEDLPVTEPGLFMGLYASDHPAVTYDQATTRLIAEEASETYTVTVQAGFEDTGEKRAVTVTVTDDDREWTDVSRFNFVDEFTFEDVPYGEYTVTAVADEEGYGSPERSVFVDDDVRVELTVPEVALREQVCDGIESDVRNVLDDVAPRLTERFETEEYLAEGMEFPFVDEYVPCMLALWAEREGMAVRHDDGQMLVFDEGRLRSRLSNIVEYNMEPDETMAFDAVRNRFLEVPASDELIVEILADSAVASEIELHETEMEKQ